MTYIVKDECIKCKLTDCVEVCPVDCFYEGENMLVIHPDECIDCGVCEPECPIDAIVSDDDPTLKDKEKWLDISAELGNQIIDWTISQTDNIHTDNYINTTYTVGDGGLTQKNFTTQLNDKLNGIPSNANYYVLPEDVSFNTIDAIDASFNSLIVNGVTIDTNGGGSSSTSQTITKKGQSRLIY